jgi:hypothetical protein
VTGSSPLDLQTVAGSEPSPVFFLSYARGRSRVGLGPDVNRDTQVRRLFNDLSRDLNELVPLPTGKEHGFMDTPIAGGEVWESTMLRAAGTCQVFVALLSSNYVFGSEWCAMEWDVFARRRAVRRGPDPTGGTTVEVAILPVLWAPIAERVPPSIRRIGSFTPHGLPDPDFARLYEENGLYGLLRTQKIDVYQSIVWSLARRIQQIHHQYYVEAGVPAGTAGLRRSFYRGDA